MASYFCIVQHNSMRAYYNFYSYATKYNKFQSEKKCHFRFNKQLRQLNCLEINAINRNA